MSSLTHTHLISVSERVSDWTWSLHKWSGKGQRSNQKTCSSLMLSVQSPNTLLTWVNVASLLVCVWIRERESVCSLTVSARGSSPLRALSECRSRAQWRCSSSSLRCALCVAWSCSPSTCAVRVRGRGRGKNRKQHESALWLAASLTGPIGRQDVSFVYCFGCLLSLIFCKAHLEAKPVLLFVWF